jgi:5-methylcytosine-specific restriction protein A
MSGKLTTAHVERSYVVATQVFDKQIPLKRGVELLVAEGVGTAYAQDLINGYRDMRLGKCYYRTLNVMATDYYLDRLYADHGAEALANAVEATSQHIAYYESLQKITLHKKRAVVAAQSIKLDADSSLIQHLQAFERDVAKAYSDSASARALRLSASSPVPQRRTLPVEVFIRNPDVVAETLHRAGGICETCRKPAPFNRKTSGKPYLEVHHRVRLADGGLDTVDNAIAVCPNCHREAHYG